MTELIARVLAPGTPASIVIRADSGFENHKAFADLHARGILFSIGVKLTKTIRALIEQIPGSDWVTVADYPEDGEAQIAETELKGFRLIVAPHPPDRRAGRAVPRPGATTALRPTAPSRPWSPISITATTPPSSW